MVERERSSIDDIIDIYQTRVDLSVLRENLRLSPEERLRRYVVPSRPPTREAFTGEGLVRDVLREHEGSSIDAIIELYKRDVDRTLLLENLKLTPQQRLQQLMAYQKFTEDARLARHRTRQGERNGRGRRHSASE